MLTAGIDGFNIFVVVDGRVANETGWTWLNLDEVVYEAAGGILLRLRHESGRARHPLVVLPPCEVALGIPQNAAQEYGEWNPDFTSDALRIVEDRSGETICIYEPDRSRPSMMASVLRWSLPGDETERRQFGVLTVLAGLSMQATTTLMSLAEPIARIMENRPALAIFAPIHPTAGSQKIAEELLPCIAANFLRGTNFNE